MKLAYPFKAKSRKASQLFGQHPSWYARFGMDGHNGIDFPVSYTDIFAADDGEVLWVKTDDDGFGLHIKVEHKHGWTLYAHLSLADVAKGEKVKRGQTIGLSGNTGNSTGPHLHFGYKPRNYDNSNGYYGYIDPLPMLGEDYSSQTMFGFYVLDGDSFDDVNEKLKQLRPRAIVVNFVNQNDWAAFRRLRDENPDVHIVGRLYKSDGEYSQRIAKDPEGYARVIYAELKNQPWFRMVDSVMTHNEVLHDAHWYSSEIRVPRLELKARFDITMMKLLKDELNNEMQHIKYHALVSARGTPDIDYNGERWDTPFHEWEVYYPALEWAVKSDNFVDVHQYGYASPMDDPSWFAMRFEQRVLPWIQTEHPDLYKEMLNSRCLFISESPWDNGKRQGWLAPGGPVNTEHAYQQLVDYAQALRPYYDAGITFGHVIFAKGSYGGWEDFDIMRTKASDTSLYQAMVDGKTYGLAPDSGGPGNGGVGDTGAIPPIHVGDGDKVNYRNITKDLIDAGVKIKKFHERDDFDPTKLTDDDRVRVVVDVWSTLDGSWDVSSDKYAMQQYIQDRYMLDWDLSCNYRSAGGATHIHFGVYDNIPDGYTKVVCNDIHLSEIGFMMYNDQGLNLYRNTDPKTGWNNLFMDKGSAFYPDSGQTGPWTLQSFGYADQVSGLGLINRWHVSIFVAYQLMTWGEYKTRFLVPAFETMRDKVMFYGDKYQMLSLNAYAALNRAMVQGIGSITAPVFSPVSNEYKIFWDDVNYVCQKADPVTLDADGNFPEPRYYFAPVTDVNKVRFFKGER